MGSRWFEVNWISALWDRRQGSDTVDIILLAIRQVMLWTLESLKRNCYSQTLQELSWRFLPTPLPSMVCAKVLCGPTMWPQLGWRRTRFYSAYPGKSRYLGQGRREPVLHCLPVLEASLGTASPSASEEMVQLWQCSQMLSKLLHVASRTWWPAKMVCIRLHPSENNPVLSSIV